MPQTLLSGRWDESMSRGVLAEGSLEAALASGGWGLNVGSAMGWPCAWD